MTEEISVWGDDPNGRIPEDEEDEGDTVVNNGWESLGNHE